MAPKAKSEESNVTTDGTETITKGWRKGREKLVIRPSLPPHSLLQHSVWLYSLLGWRGGESIE